VDNGIELNKGIVTDAKLRPRRRMYTQQGCGGVLTTDGRAAQPDGTWDNAEAHGKVAARNMAGADEISSTLPTYTTTMFGSTLAVMGVTPTCKPGLESVRTYSFEEKFYRKLFFKDDRLVGAIMNRPA